MIDTQKIRQSWDADDLKRDERIMRLFAASGCGKASVTCALRVSVKAAPPPQLMNLEKGTRASRLCTRSFCQSQNCVPLAVQFEIDLAPLGTGVIFIVRISDRKTDLAAAATSGSAGSASTCASLSRERYAEFGWIVDTGVSTTTFSRSVYSAASAKIRSLVLCAIILAQWL